MNIKNLSVGQVLKNYKELCEILEIKPTTGDSKIRQLNTLAEGVEYHKEGNKFVIDKIIKQVELIDKRTNGNNTKHIDNIEYMILNLLNRFSIKEDEKIGFSKNLLYNHCGLSNDNYKIVKGNTLKFSQVIDMPVQTINECFNYTNNRMLKTLTSALNRLKKQALITWGNGYNMVMIDEYNKEYLQVANTTDEKLILGIERSILDCWGYSSKRNVFLSGKWNTFKNECIKNLKSIYPNLRFYYDNIYFNYNPNDIKKALKKLKELDKKDVKKEVNTNFSKSLDCTIDRKHKKAKENIFGQGFKAIENYMKSDNFVPEQKQIKNTIINLDSPDVKLDNELDKSKVKYLQKTFFDAYNPKVDNNNEQVEFNYIETDEIPF